MNKRNQWIIDAVKYAFIIFRTTEILKEIDIKLIYTSANSKYYTSVDFMSVWKQ
jgi:hypothetical protein